MMKIIIIITVILIITAILKPPTLAQTNSCGTGTARAEGLVSTPDLTNTFPTSSGACIIDPKAAFAPFKIPNYADLKSLYFDQSKLPASGTSQQKYTLKGNQSGGIDLTARDKIYYISGDLSIDNPTDITGNQTGIIFVDGDLAIGPISGNKLGDNNSGLMFVVKGNVNIDTSVTQVDAVIISEGVICTAYDGVSCPSGLTDPATTSQLVINGSLISLNPDKPVKFRRALSDNSQPAEIINHQVKYLVILRDLLSDTLQKWSEIP